MTEILQQLSTADLTALATALRAGRFGTAFSEASVDKYCGKGVARSLATALNALTRDGMQDRHIALLVEAVAIACETHLRASEVVQLVRSGPETSHIANRDTGVVVRELFGSANEEVLVAGFAVHQSRDLFRRLAERMEAVPDLRVRFFLDVRRNLGGVTPPSEVVWKFLTRFRNNEWTGQRLPELFYDPRSVDENQQRRSSLHAKCIIVDRRVAFVTSANFTEAAQTRNIQVGSLIRSSAFAEELARHFDSLVATGLLRSLPG